MVQQQGSNIPQLAAAIPVHLRRNATQVAAVSRPENFSARNLTQIDAHREAVVVLTDQADDASLSLIKRLVNAIRADADEGEDGEFHSTLGYVRTSKRSSGLVRRQTREEPKEEPKADQVTAPSQAEVLAHSPALPYRSS